jgi:(p)ppGpp synthase/HD superfamily hydrolase
LKTIWLNDGLANQELEKLVELAKSMATEAHKNDIRTDGKPYLSHVEAVAESVAAHGGPPQAVIVAWLHDVLEDHADYYVEHVMKKIPSWVHDAVQAISRQPKEPYYRYLRRVLENELAIMVKIEDLRHNLLNHPPGNRKDKYELALRLMLNPPLAIHVLR